MEKAALVFIFKMHLSYLVSILNLAEILPMMSLEMFSLEDIQVLLKIFA